MLREAAHQLFPRRRVQLFRRRTFGGDVDQEESCSIDQIPISEIVRQLKDGEHAGLAGQASERPAVIALDDALAQGLASFRRRKVFEPVPSDNDEGVSTGRGRVAHWWNRWTRIKAVKAAIWYFLAHSARSTPSSNGIPLTSGYRSS